MNALELANYRPAMSPPYMFLDVCHTRVCPCWRAGKKYAPCNCGALELLHKVEQALKATEVLDCLVNDLPQREASNGN